MYFLFLHAQKYRATFCVWASPILRFISASKIPGNTKKGPSLVRFYLILRQPLYSIFQLISFT